MKKIIVVVTILILLILGGLFGVLYLNDNPNSLEMDKGLVNHQNAIDQQLSTLSGYSVDNPYIVLNPYALTPLSALIYFETEMPQSVELIIKGKSADFDITHQFEEATSHYLPIYGLYADYNNEIEIKVAGQSYFYNIQTEALPSDFILPTYVNNKQTTDQDMMYFVTPSNIGYFAAYDQNGDVRWYYDIRGLWDISRLENGNILIGTDRLVSTPYYVTGLYEIDLLGKIYTEFSLPGGYHHDVFELANGNLIVASDDFAGGTVEDVIVEVNRENGEIVKTIDLKNILPQTDGKSDSWTKTDWFHNNSVWYDEATDSLILSGRHQDAVISVDYSDATLNWIIGDSTNWSEDMQKYFFEPIGELEWQWSQHAAEVLPNGDIFIFDNGNNRSKITDQYLSASDNYSRGVIYRIDTNNMTIEQIYQYGKQRGSNFYSPYISDVDYLAENHYIVHSGGIGSVNGEAINVPAPFVQGAELNSITVEILNDEVIYELQLPSNYYRVEKLPLYNNANNYNLGLGKSVGTLGQTPIKEEKIGFTTSNLAVVDSVDLSLSLEKDRLVITGNFRKTDEIDVILRDGIKEYYYPIVIGENQYTAMCVFIPTNNNVDGEYQVTKYINDIGLNGNYNVYLRINGIVYNTFVKVNFGG